MSTTTTSGIPISLKVTSGPSTDAEINIDTPLAKYFARLNPNLLNAEIESDWRSWCNPKLIGAKVKYSTLRIGKGKGNLRISFMRTVRIPNRVDALPGSLPQSIDEFPLYNVADFPNLPHWMREKGGALMPIYQREAMWIRFSADRKFALKVLLGGVNAISGETVDLNEAPRLNPKQDYLVVPGQESLDGFATAPGEVKQFVAVPYGSGYSIEHQLTGCEAVGNIQIQVIPSYLKLPDLWSGCSAVATPRELGFGPGDRIFPEIPTLYAARGLSGAVPGPGRQPWIFFVSTSKGRIPVSVEEDATVYELRCLLQNILGTPAQTYRLLLFGDWKPLQDRHYLRQDYEIVGGGIIECMTPQIGGAGRCPTPMMMSFGAGASIKQTIIPDDSNHGIWDIDGAKTFHLQVVNAAHFEELTGIIAPNTPITIKDYESLGLPFFEVYNETPNSIYGTFGGLKSVAELDSIFHPKCSRNWSSRSRALNKCQCGLNLLDCIIRPCNHAFCSSCAYPKSKFCPECGVKVDRIMSIAAPMTAPGAEEPAPQLPVVLLASDEGMFLRSGKRKRSTITTVLRNVRPKRRIALRASPQ